jgi:hypothetical protein
MNPVRFAIKGRESISAYHEAGHVVACYVLGREMITVRIVPDHVIGEALTILAELPPLEPGPHFGLITERRLRRDIVISEAGGAAERRFLQDPGISADTLKRSEKDRKLSLDLASKLLNSSNEVEYTRFVETEFVRKAERLVEKYWPAIVRVAKVLMERTEMTSAQIDEILADFPHGARPEGEPSFSTEQVT